MAGVIEQLMEKMDVLIEHLAQNTAARLAEAPAGGAAAETKTTRTRKAAEPKADDKPKTTEAELVAKFEQLKGTDTEARMPALKKIIADQGFTSLKELRQVPGKFDATMAALVEYEGTLGDSSTEDDDDL